MKERMEVTSAETPHSRLNRQKRDKNDQKVQSKFVSSALVSDECKMVIWLGDTDLPTTVEKNVTLKENLTKN